MIWFLLLQITRDTDFTLHIHWLATILFLQFKLFQMPRNLERSKPTMINNGILRDNLTIYMCMYISISAVSSKSVQDLVVQYSKYFCR